MTTDLANSRLEERLRTAFGAVIPHLMDSAAASDWSDDPSALRVTTSALDGLADHRMRDDQGRSRLRFAAAAVLLVGAGIALWSIVSRPADSTVDPAAPVSDPGATAAGPVDSAPPASPEPTVSTIEVPTETLVPCLVEGCTPIDRLAVVPGAFDLFAGPETLGDPLVYDEFIEQVGMVRCVELTVDGTACQRVEGLAGVAVVAYPSVGVEYGTTYTSISPSEYAARWGVSGAGPAPTEDVTVRGHPGVRFPYGATEYVVWQERDDALAWVVVQSAMSDQLLTIAEGTRTIAGPETIPYLVVTPLGEPWDAEDNDSDAVVYARVGDALCVGIGWIPDPCSRVVDRSLPGTPEILSVAGAGPLDATSVRIDTGSGPQTFSTVEIAGVPEARFFLAEVAGGAGPYTLTWLASDGTELAAESLPETDTADPGTPPTVETATGTVRTVP